MMEPRGDGEFFKGDLFGGEEPSGIHVESILRDETGFRLSSGLVVKNDLIMANGETFTWDSKAKFSSGETLDFDKNAWTIFSILKPRPDLLIIGTGARTALLKKSCRDHLISLGLLVHPLNTKEAIATFNMLTAEGRTVAAALLRPRRN
ncbi:NADH dehydrogenase [ubiquinone] 1 alpha subcomplex assembly factor 3 [Neolecta irregularis DAH-3]|uniref:NADH dehydrogenase [ubiquinone] 1 alpha subcomplex assembly factor 3 n=1 Tax=Neolecta irregularis (strain DAH-3) TaxID=1198029 RepID=A0A1U7LHP3_NEOID|nr:NADH dehydrogenase [ubiquinone] 1 alpha subcomplex assembly factor 3 [Neolecta irregularis DAH-3]|eukprot:OLL22175.1 NADH dehydrogenase [ubiquinone] 1 alpha subcomplex assembly factor 3 [Neolecta irregularis DAH-3]